MTELSQVSSLHGTNPPTVKRNEWWTGGKGEKIKKGRGRKGNEVGLYWSDSTSRWGTTV